MLWRIVSLLFILYLPVYVFVLLLLKTKIKGYSARLNVVSLLATAKKPWGVVFNFSTILYGLLSFVLPVSLTLALGVSVLSVFGAFLLTLTGIATILVGIFPMNKKGKHHEIVSYLVFSSVIITGLAFIPIFNLNHIFPQYMKLVNIGVIGVTTLLAFFSYANKQTSSVLEWTSLIGTIVWNFLLAVSLFLAI